MEKTALQSDWGGLSDLNFLHPSDLWQGIHVWKGHKYFHQDEADTVVSSSDFVFDRIVGASNNLSFEGNNFNRGICVT